MQRTELPGSFLHSPLPSQVELLQRALQEARAQLLSQREANQQQALVGQDEGEKLVGVGCTGTWSEGGETDIFGVE